MTVRKLLEAKGGAVSTARPDATIQQVMDQLELDEVSAIVVMASDGGIAGIVSASDILRALNRDGPAGLERSVSEVMSSDVITCDVDEPMFRIYELMDVNRIRHVPITEGRKFCGIVNTLDVVKYRLREIAAEAEALKDYVARRA